MRNNGDIKYISQAAKAMRPYVQGWIDDTIARRVAQAGASITNIIGDGGGANEGDFYVLDFGAVGNGIVNDHAIVQSVLDAAGAYALNGSEPGGARVIFSGGHVYGTDDEWNIPANVTVVNKPNSTIRWIATPVTSHTGSDTLSTSSFIFYMNGVNDWSILNYGLIDGNVFHERFNPSGFVGAGGIGVFDCEDAYIYLGKGERVNAIASVNNSKHITVEHGWGHGYIVNALVAAEGSDYCLFNDLHGTHTFEVVDLNADCEFCVCQNLYGNNLLQELIDFDRSSNNVARNLHYRWNPAAADSYRGAWATSTVYDAENNTIGDLVLNGGIYYRCRTDHTSGTDDDEPGVGANSSTYWVRFGSDGLFIQGSAGARWSTKTPLTGSNNNIIDGFFGNVSPQSPDNFIGIEAGFNAGVVGSPVSPAGNYYCNANVIRGVRCTGGYRGIVVGIGLTTTIQAVQHLTLIDCRFNNMTQYHLYFQGELTDTSILCPGLRINGWDSLGGGSVAHIRLDHCMDVKINGVSMPEIGGAQAGIQINECDGVEIFDFHLKSADMPNASSDSGILIETTSNVLIGNGSLRNFAGTNQGGIYLSQLADNTMGNILIGGLISEGNTYIVGDDTHLLGWVCLQDVVWDGSGNIARTIGEYIVENISANADSRRATASNTLTLSNKKLVDSSVSFVDESDNSKEAKFQVSGFTTATVRTFTLPDYDGQLATLAGTETFTNKTITQPTLTLKQGTIPTAEGDLQWDATNDTFKVGDGLTTKTFSDDSKQVLLAGVQTVTGAKTFATDVTVTTGDVILDNNKAYRVKDTGGTARGIAYIDSSNVTRLGTQGGPTSTYIVAGSVTPAVAAVGTDVGVGGVVAPAGVIHADQSSTTAARPVLILDQADLSEEMIEFVTTVGVGNPIEAVGAKTLTTTHFIRVTIPGVGYRYIPCGTIA